MQIISKILFIPLLILLQVSYANEQIITVDDSHLTQSFTKGDYISIAVYHQSNQDNQNNQNNTKLTGLLLNLHYNSNILKLKDTQSLLSQNHINKEHLNSTNQKSTLRNLWLNYTKNWLGSDKTLLYQLTFIVKKDFKQTQISFSGKASSGYQLKTAKVRLAGAL